ncbi:MAG: hypothetical protein JW959_10485 [Pirellulales bacterium]|nr:hypothetical protein [Pirellulales bacterium]
MARMPLLPMMGLLSVVLCHSGCQSPYHSDRGALLGGLLGAGTGAIVGDQMGNAGAGTAIGAGLGALGGAAIGNAIDESEARNRAMIAQQLGRQVAAGAVTIDDVIAMTAAGVDEELIVNHVRANGMVAALQAGDLIRLQQQGVGKRVVAAMQEPPRQAVHPVAVQESTPVIVEEYHYAPYWGPRYYRPHRCHPHPGVSWGVSISN